MDKTQIARMIDHTILKPEATEKEVLKLCKEAVEYNFASVCINPSDSPALHSEQLRFPNQTHKEQLLQKLKPLKQKMLSKKVLQK